MMIMLFIVLFEKQTSYTFGEGTYSQGERCDKIPGLYREGAREGEGEREK